MASYPSSVKSFTTKNTGDTIAASHVNDVQDEVAAVEDALLNGVQHHSKANITNTYDLGTTSVRWRHLYLSGLLSASGLGAHAASASGTGENSWLVRNSAAGAANAASVKVTTDVTPQGQLAAFSSTYTPSGAYAASGVTVESAGSGGLALAATHASGPLKWYAGGTTKIGETVATGHQWNFSHGDIHSRNIPEVNGVELLLKGGAGKRSFLSFSETSGADRWAVGIDGGDTPLYFRFGRPNGTTVMTLLPAGVLTLAGQPRCIAYLTGNVAITSGAPYASVSWLAETLDTAGLHDVSNNQSRFTIGTGQGGFYLIVVTILWAADATATGTRGIQVTKNGATQLISTDLKPGAVAISQQAVCMAELVATDYVQASVKQDSGGNLDIVSGATFSQFMIVKLW